MSAKNWGWTDRQIAILRSTFPEIDAGGFTRLDGTVQFYVRLNALLAPEMTVLDFGAGRGEGILETQNEFKRSLRLLKGKVARVVGCDVDERVTTNPCIDEAHVITPGQPLNLPDGSIDLILADHVFEHVEEPGEVVRECERLLKPGGWVCGRTPNYNGMVSLSARLIPNALHKSVVPKLQPRRKEIDIFDTHYKLNTKRDLSRHFSSDQWDNHSYYHTAEPTYFGNSLLLFRLMRCAHTLMPAGMSDMLFVFLRKRS